MHHIHHHRKPQTKFMREVYIRWFVPAIFPLLSFLTLKEHEWLVKKFIKNSALLSLFYRFWNDINKENWIWIFGTMLKTALEEIYHCLCFVVKTHVLKIIFYYHHQKHAQFIAWVKLFAGNNFTASRAWSRIKAKDKPDLWIKVSLLYVLF